MRYELGVLQLLVASGGKNRPARLDVVERALGADPGALAPALRFLKGRGLVDASGQPTAAGASRAKWLGRDTRNSADPQVELPSRLPPASGVFARDQHGQRNVEPIELTQKKRSA